jgi:hypothetical protein
MMFGSWDDKPGGLLDDQCNKCFALPVLFFRLKPVIAEADKANDIYITSCIKQEFKMSLNNTGC